VLQPGHEEAADRQRDKRGEPEKPELDRRRRGKEMDIRPGLSRRGRFPDIDPAALHGPSRSRVAEPRL